MKTIVDAYVKRAQISILILLTLWILITLAAPRPWPTPEQSLQMMANYLQANVQAANQLAQQADAQVLANAQPPLPTPSMNTSETKTLDQVFEEAKNIPRGGSESFTLGSEDFATLNTKELVLKLIWENPVGVYRIIIENPETMTITIFH